MTQDATPMTNKTPHNFVCMVSLAIQLECELTSLTTQLAAAEARAKRRNDECEQWVKDYKELEAKRIADLRKCEDVIKGEFPDGDPLAESLVDAIRALLEETKND